MKKYLITSAIALTAFTSAIAEEVVKAETQEVKPIKMMKINPSEEVKHTSGEQKKMPMREMKDMKPMTLPTITTGDVTVDAQIKALQTEMEAKIKAVREEYQVKIKAAIGDRKVKTTNGKGMMGDGTMPKKMEGKMEDQKGTGEGHVMTDETGAPTSGKDQKGMMDMKKGDGGHPQMMHNENKVPEGGTVKGVSTADEGGQVSDAPTGVRGFFGRLFGR